MMARVIRRLWHGFHDVLDANPTLSQSVQTGLIMAGGDYIAQAFVERKKHLDTKRLCTFAGVGFFFVGPVVSNWYRVLDRKVPKHWPPLPRAATKTLLDQVIAAPVMLASVLTILELSLKDRSIEGVKHRLKTSYLKVLKGNYVVWPTVQLLNFSVTPVNLQLLVTQVVGICWNTYLSLNATR